jgi:tetratricopeptide (TPR) repeat protein
MNYRGICFCIICACFFSCASGPAKKDKPLALYGMIYDRDNKPVNNVMIYLEDRFAALSDIHGHFSIPNIKNGKDYRITAKKEHYEEESIAFHYAAMEDVLYISMYHRDQLVEEAEKALKEKNWHNAEIYLSRAEKTNAGSASAYLRGIMAFQKEDYEQALSVLTGLAEQEKTAPYLHLFIADIYQYRTADPGRALDYLRRFLDLRYDPEAEQRVRELEGAGG